MTRRERLAAFIERIWNEGDAEAASSFLGPAYVVRHDPGDPWEGQTLDPAGFVERLRLSRAPFPDQRFTIEHMAEDGDAVVMTWRWKATHLADFGPFPASGKTIRMTGATVYTFDENDLLTGHWQIADRLGVYRQLQENAPS
ncbi:ester cyclase [Novosphingobium sp. KCTC 2891]|uniref:ester cyclase n=1 Tax=Novosphingobium sp. KCTC 2891 TaxID=2989730 RepID=UPI002221B6E1|nr:ester cyclase [Novosphingobium sp. KCTC 2891]MCW1381722.1 ester cyclase [Novosphingobium sp. KCTC 2891]